MTPAQLTAAGSAIDLMCMRFNVTKGQLESESRCAGGRKDYTRERQPDVVTPRQLLMRFLVERLQIHPEQTAFLFGKCRTAVSHAIKRITDRIETEPKLRKAWEELCREVNL